MPKEFKPPSEFRPVKKRSRYLPHWEQAGSTYFLTWRLSDSVPEAVYRPWQQEREAFYLRHPKPWDDLVWKEYHQSFTRRMQQWLDACHGSCILKESLIRDIVVESLLFFQNVRYELDSWVIMPNHVHVLVTPHEGWPLPTVLHTWKSYTANMVNQRLGKAGELWMEETFDHIVRSQIQLGHYRNYIRENPVKAHLKLEEYTFWEHDSE